MIPLGGIGCACTAIFSSTPNQMKMTGSKPAVKERMRKRMRNPERMREQKALS